MQAERPRSGLPAEIAVVWLLFAAVAVEILVTYSRLPSSKLYHVTGSGLEGGASRALVFANFPLALVAIAVLLLLVDRSGGFALALGVLAIVLCAAVFWPGVVSQAKLDARPVNAVAAVGVGIALALSLRLGRPTRLLRQRGDGVRIAIAAVLLVLALPWLAADLGFFLDGVPVLGRVFFTGPYLAKEHGIPAFLPAVHHGHHHGLDGTLLVVSALLLSRLLPDVRRAWLRSLLAAYLALMLCYGAGNIANDFWLEQVVKRGWLAWTFPSVLEPAATVAWGVIVLAAAGLWLAWRSTARRARRAEL